MSEQEELEALLYDDFFAPIDAPGIPATIEVNGKSLRLEFKPLSTGDLKALMRSSVRYRIGSDGNPEIESVDEDGDALFICACLKSWPFVDRAGKPLPINKKSLADMKPSVMAAILQAVSEFSSQTIGTQQKAINGPFVKASVDHS
jgi:hypothetical protein